jgi:predicted SnoaL-like aldol condensation-catalyzing enzyme
MKHLLYSCALFLSLLLLSCNSTNADKTAVSSSSSGSTDSSAKMQADKNTANTNSVFRGIESGDLSKMNDFVSTDVVDHNMGMEVKGLDSVKKMLGDLHNHISNLKMSMITDATNGDYHFTLIKMTGTTKDNSMGMPANTPLSSTTVGVERISNGKVQEHWRFVDAGEMMKMMQQHAPMSNKAHK